MRKWWLPPILLLALVVGAGWWFRASWQRWMHLIWRGVPLEVEAAPKPDPENYAMLCRELERWRVELGGRFRNARSDEARRAVENDARILLELVLPRMMRCWLGTPWDFNGTAERPGGGRIACGYYVATVLRDAGFRLDRYQLAQQPSSRILRTFLDQDACALMIGKPYEEFADAVEAAGQGIYLIGLDSHVAFLVKERGGFRFIHASGSKPWCVVDEGRDQAEVVRKSNWRMTGNLTSHPKVVRDWLKGETIRVASTGS